MVICGVDFMSSWVDLIEVVFTCVAGGWALWQWRQDKNSRCADVYAQLLTTFTSGDVFHAFAELIDKGGFRFQGLEIEKKDSSYCNELERLDRVLMFLNQVCYLWMYKMIGEVELQAFRYPLVCALTNDEVVKYLDALQQACHGEFMYESLMKYSDTLGNLPTNGAMTTLTDEGWRKYLADHFGGWTPAAQDVAARVNTVCKHAGTSLDGLVSTVEVSRQRIKDVENMFAGKSKAQISSLRVAVRHCCMAKHGVWLKD